MEKQEEFNGLIKAIFRGGKIHPIKWGAENEMEGWNIWDIEHKLEFAMELASAMNQAADVLQQERNELLSKVATAEKLVENADKQVEIQKQIVFNNITQSNEQQQQYVEQIQRLQDRVKTLEETNDKLNERIRNEALK